MQYPQGNFRKKASGKLKRVAIQAKGRSYILHGLYRPRNKQYRLLRKQSTPWRREDIL